MNIEFRYRKPELQDTSPWVTHDVTVRFDSAEADIAISVASDGLQQIVITPKSIREFSITTTGEVE